MRLSLALAGALVLAAVLMGACGPLAPRAAPPAPTAAPSPAPIASPTPLPTPPPAPSPTAVPQPTAPPEPPAATATAVPAPVPTAPSAPTATPAPPPTPTPSGPAAELVGDWEGRLKVLGSEVPISANLQLQNGELWGTLDISARRIEDMPFKAEVQPDGGIRFVIPQESGDITFDGKLEDGVVTGTFRIGLIRGTFILERVGTAAPSGG